MNAFRPSEPDSSMPSSTNRTLTGSAMPVAAMASMACSQASTGPLSSVDPRPYIFPSFRVSSKGSVSQPSALAAGCTSKCPYTQMVFFEASVPKRATRIGGNGSPGFSSPSGCREADAHPIFSIFAFAHSIIWMQSGR